MAKKPRNVKSRRMNRRERKDYENKDAGELSRSEVLGDAK
jgi:hypothetical protein